MSRVQVLVATMHQKDFSKLQEMNIQTDAVFANQSDNLPRFSKAVSKYLFEKSCSAKDALSQIYINQKLQFLAMPRIPLDKYHLASLPIEFRT